MTPMVAALVLLSAGPASAGAGNGIRFGGSEGRLHPLLDLELRWDSNVFVTDTGQQVGDLILHARPGLALQIPGDTAAVDATAYLDWAQYFGNDDPATKDLSRLYADAKVAIDINRPGPVSLELDEFFRRSDQPQALSVPTAVVSNFNSFWARVPWRPGGGALTVAATGAWDVEGYEPFFKSGAYCGDPATGSLCDADELAKLGYNEFRAGLDGSWKFLPRTSAVLDATWFSRVPNDTTVSLEVSGLRVSTGLTGLVTAHFGGTVKAGYGDTFGSAGSTFRTWLVLAEADWLPSESSSVRFSYVHDFGTDPGLSFGLYGTHRVKVEGRTKLATRYTLGLVASYDTNDYQGPAPVTTVVRVSPTVAADVARWLRLEAGYGFTNRTTDTGAFAVPGYNYEKHEAWLKAAFTY